MKDLWDLAVAESKQGLDGVTVKQQSRERTLIICGSKGSGKSTLINSFLQKDDPIKPTIALEYSFGYLSKGSDKEAGHVYELGGGIWLAKMLNSVITPVVVRNTALAIMVDLTSPSTMFRILEQLIGHAKAAVDSAIESMDKGLAAQLREETSCRFPEDHADRQIPGLLRVFPIPLIIIGGKYDQFQAMEPEPRKQICRGLRFFAHTYGATLLFYSQRQDQLLTRANNLLSNILFGVEFTRAPVIDANKPLFIPVGADNFAQIGAPPVSESQLARGRANDPIGLWRDALGSLFPATEKDEELMRPKSAQVSNPVGDPQFAEVLIDNLRKQKDVELERYRRASERRARDLVATGSEMQDIYD